MADPARGIQNRRDFLSASPRAGRQGGWVGGSWSLGHSWSPRAGVTAAPTLSQAGLLLSCTEPTPQPPKGPGVTVSPAAWEAPQSGPLPGSHCLMICSGL